MGLVSVELATSLLRIARHPEGHGIRIHSLEVTAISSLTTEVIIGGANSPQIATR